jgi:hypothetical protein
MLSSLRECCLAVDDSHRCVLLTSGSSWRLLTLSPAVSPPIVLSSWQIRAVERHLPRKAKCRWLLRKTPVSPLLVARLCIPEDFQQHTHQNE